MILSLKEASAGNPAGAAVPERVPDTPVLASSAWASGVNSQLANSLVALGLGPPLSRHTYIV